MRNSGVLVHPWIEYIRKLTACQLFAERSAHYESSNSKWFAKCTFMNHIRAFLRHLLMSGSIESLMLDNCQFDVSAYTHTYPISHTHKHRFLWMYIKYINVHTYINICIKYRIHKFNFVLPQCVLSVFFFALCKCKCKCISENKNGGRKIRNVKSHLTDICYYYINKRIYNLLTMQ